MSGGAESDAAAVAVGIAVALLDPLTGRALARESAHALRAEGADAVRWPVVDGIAFLRTDRDALRRAVLADLDRGDARGALARLLADQDPFAPVAPPSHAGCEALVDDVEAGRTGLREAMRRLHFGPVADYFAHRTSTPTFLSGLGLLAQHGRPAGPVVEIACGIGQFLRELSARGVPTVGLDLVYSKLWLARRFVVAPASVLVCGDATRPPIAASPGDGQGATVLCHDAFYFLPDKAAAVAGFGRLAGANGRVLVGHAHNARVDQGGVSGTPLDPAGYAALFPGCALYDDGEIGALAVRGEAASLRPAGALDGAEAISIAWPAPPPGAGPAPYWRELLEPTPGARLVVNPLLQEVDGHLRPVWPSERFAAEYRAAGYLAEPATTAEEARRAAGEWSVDGVGEPSGVAAGASFPGSSPDATRLALARRRVLVELPERW